jgi:hypothetical protein
METASKHNHVPSSGSAASIRAAIIRALVRNQNVRTMFAASRCHAKGSAGLYRTTAATTLIAARAKRNAAIQVSRAYITRTAVVDIATLSFATDHAGASVR